MKSHLEWLTGLDSEEIASEDRGSYEYAAAVLAQALLPRADELPEALEARLRVLADREFDQERD